MRPNIYGPQPTAERPGEGLDNCADMLEALAQMISQCNDLSAFEYGPRSDASFGLFLLLTSISEGIRLSGKILHTKRLVRDRNAAPTVVRAAEETLARLKCVEEALVRLKKGDT